MNIIYSKHYNIDLGLLNYLHPFDGRKFGTIYTGLKNVARIEFFEPDGPVAMDIVDGFLSGVMQKKVRNSVFIFRALEVPKIPFVSMEGFCIYNDIGICYQQLRKKDVLSSVDKVLIIDTDAHHGNGNAYTFLENDRITILDVYNEAIYPMSAASRNRVDIPVPLQPGTEGREYLSRYKAALQTLGDDYRLAFVVAGTDVLTCDRLGGLCLSIDDVVKREKLTVQALRERNIPAVILGGGGYSKDSARCVISAASACAELAV